MTTDTLKSTRCPSVSDLDRQIAALLQQDDDGQEYAGQDFHDGKDQLQGTHVHSSEY